MSPSYSFRIFEQCLEGQHKECLGERVGARRLESCNCKCHRDADEAAR